METLKLSQNSLKTLEDLIQDSTEIALMEEEVVVPYDFENRNCHGTCTGTCQDTCGSTCRGGCRGACTCALTF